MSLNKRTNHEGYVMIDHRASPGITEEFIRGCGKDPALFPAVGEGKMLEAATLTCSHCQRTVILSLTRKRTRGYCPKCSHYVCDLCETARVLTGECDLMRKKIEQAQEKAFLDQQRGGDAGSAGDVGNSGILLP